MFTKPKQSIITSYEQESLSSRLERVKLGVVFGILGTTAYILSSSLINPISFPDIPLGVDWLSLLGYWLIITVALSIAGAIAGWATEEHVGVVGGGIMMGLLILLINTVTYLNAPAPRGSYFNILVTTIPLIAVSVLIAMIFRWSINRQVNNLKEENQSIKQKRSQKLFSTILIAGLVLGIFARYDRSITDSLVVLDSRLQSAGNDVASTVRFPEHIAESVSPHFGTDYRYIVHQTNSSIGAVDVTIRFEDGYILTCLIPTNSSLFLIIPACSEGSQLR